MAKSLKFFRLLTLDKSAHSAHIVKNGIKRIEIGKRK
jgi:hypothetical protein